jgi:hypothetical protein
MYVYFGDRYNSNDYHKEEVAGRVIQVGSFDFLYLFTFSLFPSSILIIVLAAEL